MNSKMQPSPTEQSLESTRIGQIMIIWAILLNFGAVFAGVLLGETIGPILSLLLSLTALVIAIIGVVKLANGLGINIAVIILCCVLLFIPLVNLITLFILSSKATRLLAANGYKVGIGGAKKL